MEERHIVSFSGGKDSTAMLIGMIERGMRIDEVIFCDTSVEFPEMYDHIKKVEKDLGIKITILKAEHDFEYYLLKYKKKKGKYKGQEGYSFPDFSSRWCTKTLKVNVINNYLKEYRKKYKVIEYVGIAFDELQRIGRSSEGKDKDIRYPLVEWEMVEKDCLEFCYEKGYTWNGLYAKFDRLSCWCCPLSRIKELRILYNDYPKLWKKLSDWQLQTYRKFRSDYTVQKLEKKFESEKNQMKIF